jgi:hypothetical protein
VCVCVEEQSKHVGVKADETTFDHSITFDDIGGIDGSKVCVRVCVYVRASVRVCVICV